MISFTNLNLRKRIGWLTNYAHTPEALTNNDQAPSFSNYNVNYSINHNKSGITATCKRIKSCDKIVSSLQRGRKTHHTMFFQVLYMPLRCIQLAA